MNYSKKNPNWQEVVRPTILKRDRYKCQSCGVRHKIRVYKNTRNHYVECDDFIEKWAKKKGLKVFTLYLHVAHLDQNKNNNDPSNLRSLCPSCHSKYNSEYKKMEKNKYKKKVEKSLNKLINK